MNVGSLLNSDVRTLRATASRGFQWWVGQLRDLFPSHRLRRRGSRPTVLWEDRTLKVLRRDGSPGRMPAKGARVLLTVPERQAFVRTLQLPRMGATDLRRLVELDAERLSPLLSTEALVGIEPGRGKNGDATVLVEVAILPLGAAREAIDAAEQAGLGVAGFELAGGNDRSPRFDFRPALRARGLVSARGGSVAIWWSVVAIALVLNVAVLVVRDEQSVTRLQGVAEQQGPAFAAARALQRRAGDFDAAAHDLQAQRRSHDVLAALAIVSNDLPAGAWVQRFTYTARTARLVGYKRKGVDVAAGLRKDPRIGALRSNTAQLMTETPAGQPFDITVVLKDYR